MSLGVGSNRIQKLLLSEYCDFSDTVLVESPFAETTRDGRGLREVALGLTPSRLVIAADILKSNSEFTCHPDLDPSIESLELVSVYPLEFVTLSIFRRRRRRTLKARLIDGRAKYYELGGMGCRNVFWSLWCTHVRDLLARNETRSSMSETTAASSSSASTLYLLSSGVEFNEDEEARGSRCRVWARYGGAGDGNSTSWPRKDVYLGPSYDELSHGYYTPVPVRFAGASLEDLAYELRDSTPKKLAGQKTCSSWPCPRNSKSTGKSEFDRGGALCDVLFTREHRRHLRRNRQDDFGDGSPPFDGNNNNHRRTAASETSAVITRHKNSCKKLQKRKSGSPRKHGSALAPKLSRFGFGVPENCGSGLYLEPWEGDREHFRRTKSSCTQTERCKLMDLAVSLWEGRGRSRKTTRHPRRYGLATAAHFLHALGPWSVQPGERESVQRRRASSVVAIRRQPVEPELRLPVSKRQLAASVSMTSLEPGKSAAAMGASARGGVILFWTPEYWYRPRAATAAYRELRRHLSLIRDFRSYKERLGRKKFFCRRKTSGRRGDCNCSAGERSSCILGKIFSSRDTTKKSRDRGEDGGTTAQLRRLLRMDLRTTVWDLDSETLARQLTLIDRDLFVRIPLSEIETLVFQRSSRNAPNIGAWIAFSHRISCITSSEILATKKLDMRTRIVARFINAAEKCSRIGNFNSCRSILAGLQSPPIYRLRATWSRLRTRHSTRYETMERLCKIYRNTGLKSYVVAWSRCEKRPPSLPYVGDLLGRILSEEGRVASKSVAWRNRPCDSTQARSGWSGGEVSSVAGNNVDAINEDCFMEKKKKNRNINSRGEVSSVAGNNVDAINEDCFMEKKKKNKNITRENVVGPRQSLGRRILSAAMMKIRSSKSGSGSIDEQREDSAFTARERMLGRKVCNRWRRFVAVTKIVAKKEAKLRDMEPKRRKVFEICTWMTDRQRDARGYNFAGHSLAWEFLLKARYREDRENFFISLKLEPPCE